MLRTNASRSILRSLNTSQVASQQFRQQFTAQLWTAARRPQTLAMTAAKPLALARLQSSDSKAGGIANVDLKHEAQKAKEKLTPSPETVSTSSSTHPIMGEVGTKDEEDNTDMMAGIRADMKTIKETFSLEGVPREAYYIGLAGVLPYLATSLSTVYCAWEINHAAVHGAGFAMNERTAELLLHVLEPLQIGYGATIISFLGAIHWGLEWAGYGGHQGYPRYAIGVVSTAFAWPTILLPAEYALISQFLIFNFLYYSDSRATKRGWAPSWYAVYRFVLTFIVGSSIVISLIGRGQIADRIGKLPGPADRIRELRESQVQSLEEEESARRRFLVSKDEEDEEEEEEGGEDEEE